MPAEENVSTWLADLRGADAAGRLLDPRRLQPPAAASGRIFVVRTEDGLVAKRLGKDNAGGWVLLSDNPGWETVPMRRGDEIIGEVRWSGPTHG